MLRVPHYFTNGGFRFCTPFIDFASIHYGGYLIPALHFWNLDNLSASMYQMLRPTVDM